MPAGSSHRTAGQRVGHTAERRTANGGGAGGARPGHRLSSRHGVHPDENRRTRRSRTRSPGPADPTGPVPPRPTGHYATETATALRAFQKRAGLPPSGEFTTADRSALLSRTRKPDDGELCRRSLRRPSTTRSAAAAEKNP
ncbi:peptidoglycan-binding domain-containing protein [Streptomyces sp. YGL11-2]|uniref:peptidoglycan-binding domain-containing protein n=1 Tax=Streptomyces sp. YGL11-2 TaxID=3414028 RepID=UPI003CEE83B5